MSSWPRSSSWPARSSISAAQPLRERDAARVDADERDRAEVLVPLDDLVGDARERALDAFGVEQDPSGRHGMLLHRTPFRPLRAELKGRCGAALYPTGRTASTARTRDGGRPRFTERGRRALRLAWAGLVRLELPLDRDLARRRDRARRDHQRGSSTGS